MWAHSPQTLLHNQALCKNGATGLSIGTDLVSFPMRESNGEQGTCAGNGVSDATEHQNKDQSTEEPHTLGGDTVGDYGRIRGRSTVKAAARPRDHEAQPGLLPTQRVSLGNA
jgi:hypothetical protein